jgi:hypothetical protein
MRQVEVFRWRFYDAALRVERLSSLHLTRHEAEHYFPGSVADLKSRETREVKDDPKVDDDRFR